MFKSFSEIESVLGNVQAKVLEGCRITIAVPTTKQMHVLRGIVAFVEFCGKELPCAINVVVAENSQGRTHQKNTNPVFGGPPGPIDTRYVAYRSDVL